MARLTARLTLFRVQSVKCQPGKLLNLTLFDVIDGLIFPIQLGRLARLHSMIPVHRHNHLQHRRPACVPPLRGVVVSAPCINKVLNTNLSPGVKHVKC